MVIENGCAILQGPGVGRLPSRIADECETAFCVILWKRILRRAQRTSSDLIAQPLLHRTSFDCSCVGLTFAKCLFAASVCKCRPRATQVPQLTEAYNWATPELLNCCNRMGCGRMTSFGPLQRVVSDQGAQSRPWSIHFSACMRIPLLSWHRRGSSESNRQNLSFHLRSTSRLDRQIASP